MACHLQLILILIIINLNTYRKLKHSFKNSNTPSSNQMLKLKTMVKILTFPFARRVRSTKITASQFQSLSKVDPNSLKVVKFGFNQKQTMIQQLDREQENAVKQSQQEIDQLLEQFQPISKQSIIKEKEKVKAAVLKELSYEGQDPNPSKLVNRPAKGVVWGLGGQLILADRKVQLSGVRDDPQQIAKFLQLHQVKNIYIHDWKKAEQPDLNRKRYSIIGSCYSARHCWKTAIELKNAFNRHMLNKSRSKSKKLDTITALMIGRKDEQWTMVQYKDFQVSLMTEEQRQAVDLEWKWNNPVSEDVVDRHAQMLMNKKKRKSNFEDFD